MTIKMLADAGFYVRERVRRAEMQEDVVGLLERPSQPLKCWLSSQCQLEEVG